MAESRFRCPEHSHKCNDPNCSDAFTLPEVLFHWRKDTERAGERGPWIKVYSNTTGDYLATGRDAQVIGVADTGDWWEARYEPEELDHLLRTSPAATLTFIDTLATLLDVADKQYGFGRMFVIGLERIVIAAGFEKVGV